MARGRRRKVKDLWESRERGGEEQSRSLLTGKHVVGGLRRDEGGPPCADAWRRLCRVACHMHNAHVTYP